MVESTNYPFLDLFDHDNNDQGEFGGPPNRLKRLYFDCLQLYLIRIWDIIEQAFLEHSFQSTECPKCKVGSNFVRSNALYTALFLSPNEWTEKEGVFMKFNTPH